MTLGSSSADLGRLGPLVARQFEVATSAGDVLYFESHSKTATPIDATASQCVPWNVRTVPALLKKPGKDTKEAPTDAASDKPAQNPKDVFAPPYVPNLLVAEMDDYTVLLNKFSVLPNHALLVTRDFVSQDMPPTPEMVATVYKIINAHRPTVPGGEVFGFFNCGPQSGASQPHCHFQLVEVAAQSGEAVPIETLLESIPKDGEEYRHTHMLPTPWQHFVVLLQPQSDDKIGAYMAERLMQGLDAMFRERMLLVQSDRDLVPAGRPSFNILVTRRALHVIPRRTDTFSLREAGWGAFAGGDVPETAGTLSVNAMGYAGFMLARHESEADALLDDKNERVAHVLGHTGFPPVSNRVDEQS
ncbi:ATP adenylyltransferase [Malassezia cuniculi]|uniref:ATP adenylyltransferase n=1 Tax=Malassezia cuniculi TaxID=948313 RepID=A0AAF0ESR2_9BASI|nr:ATP adenylyltransferase [Malassezia cuniculi]